MLSARIRNNGFFSLILDSTTDVSMNFVIRHVSDDFVVYEDFIGFYENPAKDAASIVSIIKDAFIRFNLELSDLRG